MSTHRDDFDELDRLILHTLGPVSSPSWTRPPISVPSLPTFTPRPPKTGLPRPPHPLPGDPPAGAADGTG